MTVYARKDSPFWWMWLEGTRPPVRVSTGVPIGTGSAKRQSRAQADEIYRAAMGDLARDRFTVPKDRPALLFRDHAAWYVTHVVTHHRGHTREVSLVKHLVSVFGDLPLRDLTPERIEEWKTERARTKNHNTVNRALDVLKAMLKRAVPLYLETNPAARVKKFPRRNPPITVLSETAEDAILAVASPVERAMVLLGLDALLRFGDVRTLRVEHDKGDHLMVVDPKTDPYKVPVSRRLRTALDVLHPKDGWYFPKWYRERWAPVSSTTADAIFRALCHRAGVPVGRKVGGITFHGLRHTGATRATRVVKLTVVQRLGGWKNLTQLARYDHPDDPEIMRAVEAIGSRVAHVKTATRKKARKTG